MNRLKYIKQLLTKRVLYHFLSWLTLLLALAWMEMRGNNAEYGYFLSNEFINVPFYAAIYYFISAYLIPKYLNTNHLWTYLGAVVATALVITPFKILVLYLKYQGNPEARQYLLANQYGYFLISFIVAGASTIVKITGDWARQIRERSELETRNIQSELNFLKSQINPHFLFNTLNSLYALTLKKSDDAPEIVIKLSEMMRYMLYECNEKQVPLEKEVNYIKNYLDLERLRQGKYINIQFEQTGNPDDLKIAPLLFIPFIENSFKHGVTHSISKAFVRISLDIGTDSLRFSVQNSKPEHFSNPAQRKSGGIGLVNVRRRLELLYPRKYDLKINNEPDIYSVLLTLDMKE